jgi:CBS domain-containing protein
MRAPAFCVEDGERGPVAALRMIEQRIGALPVLRGGQLTGLVTETNLVTAFRDLCRDPARSDELDRGVEELMHSLDATLSPKDSLEEALRQCGDWRIRHIPVLDENEELVGMASDRDIRLAMGRALLQGESAGAPTAGGAAGPARPATVSDVMSHQVVGIDPRAPLSRAVTVMLDARVSALPVLLDGTLLGIITRTDILEHYGSVA